METGKVKGQGINKYKQFLRKGKRRSRGTALAQHAQTFMLRQPCSPHPTRGHCFLEVAAFVVTPVLHYRYQLRNLGGMEVGQTKSRFQQKLSTAARNTGTERGRLTPWVFKGYSSPTPNLCSNHGPFGFTLSGYFCHPPPCHLPLAIYLIQRSAKCKCKLVQLIVLAIYLLE